MRRLLLVLGILVSLAIVLPPLWFTVFPADPPPELPPAGQRVALSTGVSVNVVEQGAGRPVVLVHGLPGSAYDWRRTLPELAKRGRRAIAYDRVGYGHSDPRGDDDFTIEANSRDLVALLEALDLREATVVGWSYGGPTSWNASVIDGSRMSKLVLVGTGGPQKADDRPPEPSLLFRAFYSGPAMAWRSAVPPVGVGLMRALSNVAYSEQPQPDWWLDALRANLARPETLTAYRGELFGVAEGGSFDPQTVTLPTLLLHGDDDRLAPVATARYLATALPNATLVEYPGASHMLPVTHAEDIAERIARF